MITHIQVVTQDPALSPRLGHKASDVSSLLGPQHNSAGCRVRVTVAEDKLKQSQPFLDDLKAKGAPCERHSDARTPATAIHNMVVT